MKRFARVTTTFSIIAEFDTTEQAPYGPVSFIAQGKKLLMWEDGMPFYHFPIATMLRQILKLTLESHCTEVRNLSSSEIDSLTSRGNRLISTECLDGATYYIISSQREVAFFWYPWNDWGKESDQQSNANVAIADKDDVVCTIRAYLDYVDDEFQI